MPSAPRWMAPCRAVSPLPSTAFTSLPSAHASSTAASASSLVPGFSPIFQMPTPAAAIIGVAPLAVVRPGSAPRSASSRIIGTSAAFAARRNGVAPTRSSMLRLPSRGSAVWPRLGSAPCAIRMRAMSRPSSRPSGTGNGGLRPRLGRRVHTTWCSAVQPCPRASGSAPAASSRAAISYWALYTAMPRALVPSGRVSSGSAPAASSTSSAARLPSRAANSSGVNPPPDRACTSAPAAISAPAAPGLSCEAVHISAVWPRQPSTASTSAPCSMSTSTARTTPVRATVINGVSPSPDARLGSAPASSSLSSMSALPLVAARAIGAMP